MKIDELAILMGKTRGEVKHILETNDVIELDLTNYSGIVRERKYFEDVK